MRLTVGAGFAIALLSLAGPAQAEELKPKAPGVFSAERLRQAVEAVPPQRQSQTAAPRRRDPIWNGGLIGAAIGGVGGSALIVAAHGGSDNIGRAMLNVCVPPALAGFAVGAVIDALR